MRIGAQGCREVEFGLRRCAAGVGRGGLEMRLWSKEVLALWVLEGGAASMDGGGARRWCGVCREGGDVVHGEDGGCCLVAERGAWAQGC